MSIIQDLITTLEDGRKGYAEAAEKLSESGHAAWSQKMQSLSKQRQEFSARLQSAARGDGMDVDSDGSALAGLHRTWMSLKDMVAGDDADGTLEAAISGEEHALEKFEDALKDEDLSAGYLPLVSEQAAAIASSKAELEQLRDAAS